MVMLLVLIGNQIELLVVYDVVMSKLMLWRQQHGGYVGSARIVIVVMIAVIVT